MDDETCSARFNHSTYSAQMKLHQKMQGCTLTYPAHPSLTAQSDELTALVSAHRVVSYLVRERSRERSPLIIEIVMIFIAFPYDMFPSSCCRFPHMFVIYFVFKTRLGHHTGSELPQWHPQVPPHVGLSLSEFS